MKKLIGFWVISLVITILIVGSETTYSTKEKIIRVIWFMTLLSLEIASVILMLEVCV